MSRINTPTNQKLLTNIAIVRIKKTGKRFEIACYKNKVQSYRQGNEKDLDEVLQSETVFVNVSKGQVAKKEDLIKAFNTDDQLKVCKEILAKGDLQVSDKERQAANDAMFKEIATTVADKCVNPENQRPYPVSMIEKAMKEIHIAVKPNKSTKVQSLDAIQKLKEHLPLEKAQMRVKISVPIKSNKPIKQRLKSMSIKPEKEDKVEDTFVWICLIDPGQYRVLDELVRNETNGDGVMELVDLKGVAEESEDQALKG